MSAGDGPCNLAAVKTLLEEGPQRIEELITWVPQWHQTGLRAGKSPQPPLQSCTLRGTRRNEKYSEFFTLRQSHSSTFRLLNFVSTNLLSDEKDESPESAFSTEKGVPQEVACSAVLLATGRGWASFIATRPIPVWLRQTA